MDDRILRRLFKPTISILRWPLKLFPTYAMIFGQDSRPAGILLCILFAMVVAAIIEAKVRPVNATTACKCTMWCFFALSALSISISLPMPDSQLSTLRCYAVLALLALQACCLVAELDLDSASVPLHLFASLQLPLLPGTWSRLSELAKNDSDLALFLIILGYFVWTILGIVWSSPLKETNSNKESGHLSPAEASKTLKDTSDIANEKDGTGSLKQAEVDIVLTTSAVNFLFLAVLQFY